MLIHVMGGPMDNGQSTCPYLILLKVGQVAYPKVAFLLTSGKRYESDKQISHNESLTCQ